MDGMLELLRLINALGKVDGRKKLQKIVYILQSMGYPFPQRFGYLHYGPYSSGLAAEMDSLVSAGLVTEQKRDGGGYESYVYELGADATNLLKELKKTDEPIWATHAVKFNKQDANSLEALSTVIYLRKNGFCGDGLRDRFTALKPQLKKYYESALEAETKLPKPKLSPRAVGTSAIY
jgi:uncharacterized protein YwgA